MVLMHKKKDAKVQTKLKLQFLHIHGETVYNPYASSVPEFKSNYLQNFSFYGGQSSKNIYLGETRIVTKLNSGENPTYSEEYNKQY